MRHEVRTIPATTERSGHTEQGNRFAEKQDADEHRRQRKSITQCNGPGCAELVDAGVVAVTHDRLENAGYGNSDDGG